MGSSFAEDSFLEEKKEKMKILIVFGIALLSFYSGCKEADVEFVEESDPEQIENIEYVCDVGEMMGDSNYVFGEIASALPTPGGGVAVLDLYSCKISFFDSTGLFIRSIGGKGEGPGEFLLPLDFVILEDGRIAVSDLVNRRIDILSEDGELLNSLETGNAMLPFKMSAVADSSFMIYYYSTRPNGDNFDMGFNLEIWDPTGFKQEVWSWRSPYTGSDYTFSPGYISCCSGNGKIFYAGMDNSAYSIDFVDTADGSSGCISGEATSIEADSSDTGYIEPKVFVNYSIGDALVDLESQPLSNRPQIASMGVDSENRLWARKGTTNSEEWLLYSPEGGIVCEGRITGIPEAGRLTYVINENGAIAWAPFTEEYPRVFLLSID